MTGRREPDVNDGAARRAGFPSLGRNPPPCAPQSRVTAAAARA